MSFDLNVKSFSKIFFGLGALALILAGCPGKSSNNPTSPNPPADTPTPTVTSTLSTTPTKTLTATPSSTASRTATLTPTATLNTTITSTFTSTWTPVTILVTATFSFTPTSTATLSPTATATDTPTATSTFTITNTSTNSATATPTLTATDSPTATPTGTPTSTTTDTATPTGTPTSTPAIGPTYAAGMTFGSFATMGNVTSLCVSGSNIWVLGFSQLTEWAVAGLGSSSVPTTTITAFGPSNSVTFGQATQVTVDPNTGNVYVGDRGNGITGQVDVFDPLGNYQTSFGNNLFTVTNAGARAVAVNSSGTTVYTWDSGNQQCYAWSITSGTPPTYTYLSTFANSGPGAVGFSSGDMALDNSGNLWIALGGNVINEYNYAGVYQQSVTLPGSQVLNEVVFDGSNDLFGIDTYSPGYVAEFNPAAAAVTHYTDGFTYPEGLAFDSTYNNLYVTSGHGDVIDFQKQ